MVAVEYVVLLEQLRVRASESMAIAIWVGVVEQL
jgi:hypothetical protein